MPTPSEHFQADIDANTSMDNPRAFEALAKGLKSLADQLATIKPGDPRLTTMQQDVEKIRVYLGMES